VRLVHRQGSDSGGSVVLGFVLGYLPPYLFESDMYMQQQPAAFGLCSRAPETT